MYFLFSNQCIFSVSQYLIGEIVISNLLDNLLFTINVVSLFPSTVLCKFCFYFTGQIATSNQQILVATQYLFGQIICNLLAKFSAFFFFNVLSLFPSVLITYTEDHAPGTEWQGYGICLLMLLIGQFRIFLFNYSMMESFTLGMAVRSVLTTAIYEKVSNSQSITAVKSLTCFQCHIGHARFYNIHHLVCWLLRVVSWSSPILRLGTTFKRGNNPF